MPRGYFRFRSPVHSRIETAVAIPALILGAFLWWLFLDWVAPYMGDSVWRFLGFGAVILAAMFVIPLAVGTLLLATVGRFLVSLFDSAFETHKEFLGIECEGGSPTHRCERCEAAARSL